MLRQAESQRSLVTCFAVAAAVLSLARPVAANDGAAVQERIDADLAEGRPLVVHVVVALCDNENQGIVPVPESLGNGQDPKNNLYWGALYGVRTYLGRAKGWTRLKVSPSENENILDRVAFVTTVERAGQPVPVHVVADAWDGAKMRAAITAYLTMAAGHRHETVTVETEGGQRELDAGGQAQLVAFVGHDGLMDFALRTPREASEETGARSAMVLACISKDYFSPHLKTAGAHPLLLTTGLMAPEAYTLEAAIRTWASGQDTAAVRESAAAAYHRYQNCGLRAARGLFWGAP